MEIIPVIDLLDGQVVRAERGDRANYRPINSALSSSSSPLAVAQALLGLYPFNILYIADLDAIQKRGNHFSTIAAIRKTWPKVDFWLDAGFTCHEACNQWQKLDVTFVVGSESLGSIAELRLMRDIIGDERLVLSLDWRGDAPLGPAALFKSRNDWPQRVILMRMERVGSYTGVDMEHLKQACCLGADKAIHAAGGVRDAGDLQTLKIMGIAGVLLASALHDGRIGGEALAELANQ